MFLEKFVQTLLPNFSGEVVESNLKSVKVECVEKTYPPYRSVREAKLFEGNRPFQHSWTNTANGLIMNGLHKTRLVKDQPHFVYVIERILSQVPERIEELIKMSNINSGREISKTGITYPQANIIRLSELLEFFMVYARKLLLHVYTKEHESLSDKSSLLSEPLSPLEVKWLERHMDSFIMLLNVFAADKENYIRAIKSIPEITIESDEQVQQAVKANAGAKLDPFNLGIIPYTWNPIYHIRMGIAEWRKSRLDAAISERELLEMRLELVMAKQRGESNARLEKNIEGMQNRLKKLNVKIMELEESFKETK